MTGVQRSEIAVVTSSYQNFHCSYVCMVFRIYYIVFICILKCILRLYHPQFKQKRFWIQNLARIPKEANTQFCESFPGVQHSIKLFFFVCLDL